MAAPTDVHHGDDNHVASAHIWLEGDDPVASATSFGELAGGAVTDYAYMGICTTITTALTNTINKVPAENSKLPVKYTNADFEMTIEAESMIGATWVRSAANGFLSTYAADTAIPADLPDIEVKALILFLKDDADWEVQAAALAHDGGYWIKKAILTGMGVSQAFDGSARKVYKWKLSVIKDDDGDRYTDIIPGNFTPTAADYTTVT
jgi:hypothetical protein